MDEIRVSRLERDSPTWAEATAACARLMAESDPWRRLGRTSEDGLRLFSNPLAEIFVVWAGSEVAGFGILLMHGALRGYIQSIGVMPQWRSRGIGSRLIAYIEERVFGETPNVFLCVSSFNHDAQRWYKRLGYEQVGELKDYLVRGHSELLMRKTRGPLIET